LVGHNRSAPLDVVPAPFSDLTVIENHLNDRKEAKVCARFSSSQAYAQ
jgi:hypothetical protein